MTSLLQQNLLSPLVLSFALGLLAKLAGSELTFPKEVYAGLSIYLLFALGLHGGVELSQASLGAIAGPALATVLLGLVTPVAAWLVLRRLGRFSISDAAGIAAHYGSVSAVTFIAASQFVAAAGHPAEGFLPTLLTLLESPGIHVALAIGSVGLLREARQRALQGGTTGAAEGSGPGGAAAPLRGDSSVLLASSVEHRQGEKLRETLREILTARTMVLLVGGLLVGFVTGSRGWAPIKEFFDSGSPAFRGALCLFLLEMGLVAGERMSDVRRVGPFLLAFGVVMPVLFGALGVLMGRLSGLGPGGATVLGAMAASASYIAAPPAVRQTLPAANPSFSLTLALVITFPFNLLAGIPLYYRFATLVAG